MQQGSPRHTSGSSPHQPPCGYAPRQSATRLATSRPRQDMQPQRLPEGPNPKEAPGFAKASSTVPADRTHTVQSIQAQSARSSPDATPRFSTHSELLILNA